MKKITIVVLLLTIFSLASSAQVVDFSYSSNDGALCNLKQITFIQNAAGNPTGFIWSFGNRQSGTKPTESIIYAVAGSYTVTLTALYAKKAISVSKVITIGQTPTVALTADKNNLCMPGIINFKANGSSFITNYDWDFNDGSPLISSVNNIVSQNYLQYGTFNASVRATTAMGCIAEGKFPIQVKKIGITGSVSPDSGCVPINTFFNVRSTLPPGDAPLNYTWSFGDGSPVIINTTNTFNHFYLTATNINNANVIVTSVKGCTNQFVFKEVAYGTAPFNTYAKTFSSRDTFCGSEKITFYAKANNASRYVWDFGDGSKVVVSDTLVIHKYKSLGNKRVIVTPFFNGCPGTKDTIKLFIEGVIANFKYTNSCINKNVFQFRNTSLGNVSNFTWGFSDAPGLRDSINYNALHHFPLTGSFKTILSLTDSSTGCKDEKEIDIYTALPVFERTKINICKDSLVTYRVSETYPGNAGFIYKFNVGGDSINNSEDSVLNYYPGRQGNFNDKVLIINTIGGTCIDTLQIRDSLLVRGPVVSFTATNRFCVDKALIVVNNSYPYTATDTMLKWQWDFGANKRDTTQNPSPQLYNLASTYTIKLNATDKNGCSQTSQQVITIYPLPQIVTFPSESNICQSRDSVMLTAFSIDSLLWTSSSNLSCIYCDTTIAYPTVTTQYIAKAINRFGCLNYDTCNVKVFSPFSLNVYPADTSVCLGSPVNFTHNAQGITTWFPSTYLLNVENNSNTQVSIPKEGIVYKIIEIDSAGCYSDTAIARIGIYPFPKVNAGPDKVMQFNSIFNVSPTYSSDVSTYLWKPAVGLNCANCSTVEGVALKRASYSIEVTSINGCKASDSINLFLACEKGNIQLPGAFTPDNNGINDFFYPIAKGYRIIKSFSIFNRAGNKVFERKNFAPNIASFGWDGAVKSTGISASAETFAWYIEAECDMGELVTSKGTVMLLR